MATADGQEIMAPKQFIIPTIQSNTPATNQISGSLCISGTSLMVWMRGQWNYISGQTAVIPVTGA